MKMPSLKLLLFSLLFAMLFLPELQNLYPVYSFKPLTGEFIPAEKQKFTVSGWFEGDFQKAYDKYFEEQIGFRIPLIRLYNQVDFSLFRVAHGGDIVVGKDGYLFQTQYLTAHAGKDFIGEKEIDARLERIKYVIKALREKGIYVVIAFAPTKADFFAEYVPRYYSRSDTTPTNYDIYRKKLIDDELPFIDFNAYFLKLKNTSPYPLFPKQGIHWSQYGMYLSVDSLLAYFREKINLDLNNLYCDNISLSYELKSTDYDLGDLCNVIFDMPHYEMPYPSLRFEKNPAKRRPNLLTIGDSFYWNIYNSEVPKYIFNGANFWYYNHDVYADSLPQKEVVNLSTFMNEIDRQQVILVLQTESNLNNLGLGFFETVYDALQSKELISPVAKMEEEIRKDPVWLESVRKKAIERNVSLDAMIRSDAEWMVEQERAKKK